MARYLQCTSSAGTKFKILSPKDDPKNPKPLILKEIQVAGGANVRDAKSIMTPNGACTEVSDEDYALLEKDHTFQEMVESGHIIVTTDHHLNVKDNKKKDGAAPKTPADYKESRKNSESPVPTTGGPEEK